MKIFFNKKKKKDCDDFCIELCSNDYDTKEALHNLQMQHSKAKSIEGKLKSGNLKESELLEEASEIIEKQVKKKQGFGAFLKKMESQCTHPGTLTVV